MRRSRVLLSCLVSIVFASAASAAWIPLTGDPVSLSSLEGGSLTFGDKGLSDVEFSGVASGGAFPPNPDTMTVQGGQDSVTGDYGLRFNFSWVAASNQTINATLNFKMSILPGYDDYFINGVSLYLTGVSAFGTGGVYVGENVWDAAFPEGNIVASLSCSKQQNDGNANLVDQAGFTPLKEGWTRSIDFSLSGGTNGGAHLSEFYQFYSQIPEPTTLLLLGLGGLVLLRKRRT